MNKTFRLLLTLLLLLLLLGGTVYAGLRLLYPRNYEAEVSALSAEFDVDQSLIYAVISCESGFDPDACSDAGALGLMQLTPETFEWVQKTVDGDVSYDESALLDPAINLRYGVALLSLHLTEFEATETALAAYHAGRGCVNGWLADADLSPDGQTLTTIPYADTASYVKKVMQTEKIYRILYPEE